MATEELKPIPEPSLRRLPIYLQYLKHARQAGKNEISTTLIAGDLKLDPTQVRKDLAYTGIIGKPKVGYNVDTLIKGIEDYLNWNNLSDAFLAGVGNLGLAMLGFEQFTKYGIRIVALFDNDERKIGTEVSGVPVLPVEKMTGLAERMHIHIGIITVPASAAQTVAEMMVEGGIKAIWNFAPVMLRLPENIIVENAQFATSLAVLTRKLAESIKQGE
ncbi:MAG: redox-sensing transcriptional repressor Rex [Ignavibacteria bacterium]|jgi:redox-sensing transcriptional repressor|nr:redox-sensing transcriptional repressor Rex [Ignavibacteria bacterium]MCU7498229.1 redox-sensing transcriptional repressor Rex [Ignavibacteria bacterium]MCU7511279.1 redox-sensing transcriptional repressor Rex [Ignavibacteria bacterium]